MKAMVIDHAGEHGTLSLREVADPVPGPRDVLLRARAAALNRADLSQRLGRYSQQATVREGPRIAGLETAGEVIAVGEQVSRFSPGDRVMGQCSGGYAELVVVDERLLLHVPDTLAFEQAAATPVSLVTEHDALVTNAGLRSGESVLVQAAGSAMGLMAVQIARLLGARPIFGTVASEAQASLARELGADVVVRHDRESFADAIERETEGRGVDVVIDHVGGAVLGENMRCLAVGGRLVSVGRLGPTTGTIDLDLLALKRLRLIGVTFRTRTLDEYGACVTAAASLLPALAEGALRPTIDSVHPLEHAMEAQERMAANVHLGKIVLSVQPGQEPAV